MSKTKCQYKRFLKTQYVVNYIHIFYRKILALVYGKRGSCVHLWVRQLTDDIKNYLYSDLGNIQEVYYQHLRTVLQPDYNNKLRQFE